MIQKIKPVRYKNYEVAIIYIPESKEYITSPISVVGEPPIRELMVSGTSVDEVEQKFKCVAESYFNSLAGAKYVYICSPYRGDTEANTELARTYCKMSALNGYIPIAPHIYFTQFLNDEGEQRDLGMKMGRDMMYMCSELWVFGNEITDGMKTEIEYAKMLGIPVKKDGARRFE